MNPPAAKPVAQSYAPGRTIWLSGHGIVVWRLHYSAHNQKADGERTHVPEIKRDLSPWALKQFRGMTNPSLYLKELEIDAEATLGQLLFRLDEEATLEDSFPIPEDWTRVMSLDPHPGIPHAFLWCAVDPWGDRWYYRELWPSEVCFRYQGAALLGRPGPCPPGEKVEGGIKTYAEVLRYLESADNPENAARDGHRFDEAIHKRVIDYAARAFGKGTNDDPEQPNFQQRYELHMKGRVTRPFFDDAKKDHDVGIDTVNEGLKPREVMGNDGQYRRRSAIHIFRDRCPELVYQLKNNRTQQLTPLQAERMDPTGQPVKVRNHMTDNLRYIEMAKPAYVRPSKPSTWTPREAGIAY